MPDDVRTLDDERCVICGRRALTEYPPQREDAAPSCGRIACELQMQAAEDFHDEHSG